MDEVEIIGTFDSGETAGGVARALNVWFRWIMEGDLENPPEIFADFGAEIEDYSLDRDSDEVDWSEAPTAEANGNSVTVVLETTETVDTICELIEALGAYEVHQSSEDEGDDEDA